jgi:hypothetical protein
MESTEATFPVLFLIGRPAAGKSEIIDFLKRVPEARRAGTFHIRRFLEIDDFPMIWNWFEEDDILSRLGKPRLHTDRMGYFLFPELWHVLVRRLELEYWKMKEDGLLDEGTTAIIEFARGKEHGGFREAFAHFSDELLARAAVLYIDVSFAESLRKNRRRFNPSRPHSILEHALPDAKMKKLYAESDWQELAAGHPGRLRLGCREAPYAVFANQDDVTSGSDEQLGARLEECLRTLWERYRA